MRDFILKYWPQGLYALITAIFAWAGKRLSNEVKQNKQDNEAMRAGMKALLRAEIISTYNHYENAGYMPIYARENLHDLHKQYTALGGNGAINDLMEIASEWPTKKEF